jgi:transcriptional regulator with XRE-family HTH domain
MSQPALSRLEAGVVVPTIPLLDRISAALDADLIVEIAPARRIATAPGALRGHRLNALPFADVQSYSGRAARQEMSSVPGRRCPRCSLVV